MSEGISFSMISVQREKERGYCKNEMMGSNAILMLACLYVRQGGTTKCTAVDKTRCSFDSLALEGPEPYPREPGMDVQMVSSLSCDCEHGNISKRRSGGEHE